MNKHPIYLVDDDMEDSEMVQEIWQQLSITNELKCFTTGQMLIDQLTNSDEVPFIIICDLNLPKMDGFTIREKLISNPETRYKTVPFIFWSNTASTEQIKKAYDVGAHGMFIKGSSMDELRQSFTRIVDYWQTSLKPA